MVPSGLQTGHSTHGHLTWSQLMTARAGHRSGLNPARTGPVQPSRLGDDSAFDLVHRSPIIEHTFDDCTN